MKNVIIGTAGHVDHGKTLLIKALTGTDTDRLREEKRRGITIELGFAYIDFKDGVRAGIIDVPGHERFIKNMLAGAGGIDLAMLVIAADEGVMPQTIEHLGILSLLGITEGMVVVTKVDKVDADWLEMIRDEICEVLKGTFLEGKPVVEVSAYTGKGLEELKDLLYESVCMADKKEEDVPFRLPVDRVFSVDGFGTVITGTLIEGQVAVGEEITLYPKEVAARVRNLQVHGNDVGHAYAGQRVAVNLAGLQKADVRRGDVLAATGSLRAYRSLDVWVQMLPQTPWEIKNGDRVHLYHGARTMLCKCVLMGTDRLQPGGSGYAQLVLDEELPAKVGDRFVLRFFSPVETIGGGTVLDVGTPPVRKRDTERLAHLEVLQAGRPEDRVLHAIARGFAGTERWEDYYRYLPMSEKGAEEALKALVQQGKVFEYAPGRYLTAQQLEKLAGRAQAVLEKHHEENPLQNGMRPSELHQKLFAAAAPALGEGLLNALKARGDIRYADGLYAAKGFAVELSADQQRIMQRLAQRYAEGGYAPPDTDEVMAEFAKEKVAAKRVLQAMVTEGRLVMLTPQIIWSGENYRAALEKLRAHAGEAGRFALADLRDLLGTSRKYALAFAEYLDKTKVTRREGDARVFIEKK
ncbi:MAG: selenocysteine-specific translation elongation factor [Oscillospiraceae bacterium]